MRKILLALTLLLAAAFPAAALEANKVQVHLISDRDAVRPGSTFTVAVEQDIAPGWHTYWLNPGEAGAATEVQWTLPPGWKAGPIAWPYPMPLPIGPLMDYGYEGKVWLLVDITVAQDAAPAPVTLSAKVQSLVCQNICVPEEASAALPLVVDPAAAAPDASSTAQFAAAKAKLPAASPWVMHFTKGTELQLYVQSDALAGTARPKAAYFFPATSNLITDAAPQKLSFTKTGLVLHLMPAEKPALSGTLDGVLVLTSEDGSVQALTVAATPGAVPADSGSDFSLWLILAFAALGGLILNIMPCVLPVLAMKALALAGHAGADRRPARVESFSYALGAILSFVAFGLVIVALRAGGSAVGWGFQLQEPLVVAGLALLMFAVGLNLSGVFEFQPITAGDSLTRRGGVWGAFFTGVLAVAMAAPCTAPFMATAVGYGLTQSAPVVIGVFAALGLGFALPFIVLGILPALHRILPKPGAWMLRLKHWLALPMYGTAIWLLWVLAKQVDQNGLIAALGALLALGIALALWGRLAMMSGFARLMAALAVLIATGAMVTALVFVHGSKPAVMDKAVSHAGMAAEPFTPARLAALRKEGRPVFIDATASWCITCMVNEEAALSRPAVHEAFAKKKIVFLVADWTNRNPEITALLQAHGRSGVPLYLYYAPGAAEPVILPQILTEGTVLSALGQ